MYVTKQSEREEDLLLLLLYFEGWILWLFNKSATLMVSDKFSRMGSISYFPYFKFATLKTRVILCKTLKKEGRAFRSIFYTV